MANLYKKPVIVTDPKTGQKIKTKSRKWWGRYRDENGVERRVPLAVDKAAAQAMLNELTKKVKHRSLGLWTDSTNTANVQLLTTWQILRSISRRRETARSRSSWLPCAADASLPPAALLSPETSRQAAFKLTLQICERRKT